MKIDIFRMTERIVSTNLIGKGIVNEALFRRLICVMNKCLFILLRKGSSCVSVNMESFLFSIYVSNSTISQIQKQDDICNKDKLLHTTTYAEIVSSYYKNQSNNRNSCLQKVPIFVYFADQMQPLSSNVPQSNSATIDFNNDANRDVFKVPVYLNVYNFWSCFNKVCSPIGLGVYHTGVEIFGDEYMFFGFDGNETGVGFIEPQTAIYEFSEKILLGYIHYTFFELDQDIMDPLRLEFTGNKYDLLNNNCNHFSKRLARQLKAEERFPPKIFRITDFCNKFRCCIPECILNGRLDWFNWDKNQSQDYEGDCYSHSNEEGYHELREQILGLDKSRHERHSKSQSKIDASSPRISYAQNLHPDAHPDQHPNTTLPSGIEPQVVSPNHHRNSIGNSTYHQRSQESKISLNQMRQSYPKEDVQLHLPNQLPQKI